MKQQSWEWLKMNSNQKQSISPTGNGSYSKVRIGTYFFSTWLVVVSQPCALHSIPAYIPCRSRFSLNTKHVCFSNASEAHSVKVLLMWGKRRRYQLPRLQPALPQPVDTAVGERDAETSVTQHAGTCVFTDCICIVSECYTEHERATVISNLPLLKRPCHWCAAKWPFQVGTLASSPLTAQCRRHGAATAPCTATVAGSPWAEGTEMLRRNKSRFPPQTHFQSSFSHSKGNVLSSSFYLIVTQG